MLAFATIVVTIALVLVELNQQQEVTRSLLYYGAAYLVLFGTAHIVVRFWLHTPTRSSCPASHCSTAGTGAHLPLDLADATAAASVGDPSRPATFPYQIAWTALASAVRGGPGSGPRPPHAGPLRHTCGLVGLALLALPGLLPGAISEVNGAKICCGSVGWEYSRASSPRSTDDLRCLLPGGQTDLFTTAGRSVLGMELPRPEISRRADGLGLSLVSLVLEKDLGTSLLFFGIVLVLIYIATERVAWLVIGLVFFVGGAMVSACSLPMCKTG